MLLWSRILIFFNTQSSVLEEKEMRMRGLGAVLEIDPKELNKWKGCSVASDSRRPVELRFCSGIFIFALFIVSGKQTAFYKLENAIWI